jgi:hypothetical protein
MLWITFKSIELPGLELIQSCVDPFCQWFLPWPTKGWPCEIMGLESFARPSSLLMDPGDIYPPQEAKLTSGAKSGDHRLQNLEHHRGERERERWRRGGCCAGKLNERNEEKGERAHGGGTGALGRAGQSGPGWVPSRGKNPRHTQP